MPEQPREPEFLPPWYAGRLTRSRRRRALVRAAVALSLAGAAGAALFPRPLSTAHADSGTVADALPAIDDAKPEAVAVPTGRAALAKLPPGARRVLQALHDVLPSGVAVERLAFGNDGGVTTVSFRCTAGEADAAGELAEALRALPLFADVRLECGTAAGADAAPGGPRPKLATDFDVHATVTAAEAR